jgi:hypothetical protein
VAEANAKPLIGFGDETRIGKWKRAMLHLGGGRSELFVNKQEQNGLSAEAALEQRRKWGAGEDFFLINQQVSTGTQSQPRSVELTDEIVPSRGIRSVKVGN